MLQIFLTSAVTVATCERCFSKLKLINQDLLKIYYENLTVRNFAIISIEIKTFLMTDEIIFDNVIEEFANKIANKVTFSLYFAFS